MPNSPSFPPLGEPENYQTAYPGTSEPSNLHGQKDTKDELQPSSQDTTQTASIVEPSTETSKPSTLDILRLYLSLLAGYLAKIQGVKRGRVLVEELTMTQPDGKRYKVIKILIGVDNASAVVVERGSDITLDVVEKDVQ